MTGDKITRLDTARGGLAADLTLYGLSAAFAGATALTSTLLPHRAWGSIAVFGYAAATLIALGQLFISRRPPRAAGIAPGGTPSAASTPVGMSPTGSSPPGASATENFRVGPPPAGDSPGAPPASDDFPVGTPPAGNSPDRVSSAGPVPSAGTSVPAVSSAVRSASGTSAAVGGSSGGVVAADGLSAAPRSGAWWAPGRWSVAVGAFVAVAVLPMLVEAVQRAGGRGDRAQEEVWVVERAGTRLWETGSPYLGRAAIDALPAVDRLDAYMPYQPGMAVFGLPRAIAGDGWWTDARVWFALVFVVALGWALRVGGSGPARVRALQAAAVFPVSALTLATGGDDLPVLGLCLLALAFAARQRWAATGIAVGVAGALKLFAWPVALVLIAYALLRPRPAVDARPPAVSPLAAGAVPDAGFPQGSALGAGGAPDAGFPRGSALGAGATPDAGFPQGYALAAGETSSAGSPSTAGAVSAAEALSAIGLPHAAGTAGNDRVDAGTGAHARRRKDALAVAAGAIGLPILALIPALIVNADSLVENILRFPMGHGAVTSPAQSPFPGFLIKRHLPAGGFIADALLLLAGVAIAVWLVRRPPRDAGAAAFVCAVGILAVILLLPASRFGYLMYPVAFVGWIPLLRTATAGRRRPDAAGRSAGRGPRPRRRTASR